MPDLRGHGSTPLPPGEYSHADDLLRMLDDLRIERATLVGASFGGWVALQLATKAPERVDGAGPAGLDRPRPRRREWSPEIVAFREKEEALLEADDIEGAVALGLRVWKPRPGVRDLVEEMTRDAFELQQGVEAQERPLPVDLAPSRSRPSSSRAARTRCPTSPASPTSFAAEIHGAERAVIKDAGHLIALERPDATAELLRPWLERVSA